MNQHIKQVVCIGLISVTFWGCGSSAEYTSAKMAIKEENWEKAEEYLFKALEVEPDNAEVMVQIGYNVYAKKREWAEMNAIFKRAVESGETKKMNGRPISEVVSNYRSMLWAENYNKAIGSYNTFKQSNDKEVLKASIDLFNQSLEIDPNETQTYSILASRYYELGDNENAISMGRQAANLMPNEYQPNMTLGQLLFITGNKVEGVQFVEKAVQIDPSNSDAIVVLATYYYESGNTEKAVETFQAAIDKQEDKIVKADIYFNLGVLHMELNNFDEADIAFEEAYYFNPEDFEALVGMASIYEQFGDLYFNGTEEEFPKDYYKAERWYKKARSKYKDLNELDPGNESKYQKSLKLIDYKLNISVENQN